MLHLANTDFEFELVNQKAFSLQKGMSFRSLTLQLFFVPMLYANAGDGILVYGEPPQNYKQQLLNTGLWLEDQIPIFCNVKEMMIDNFSEIRSWGASHRLKKWALDKNLHYVMPDWGLVREVNSKEFTFTNCPKLPEASLLYHPKQVREWICKTNCKKVLKSCYGIAGRGHLIIDPMRIVDEDLEFFLQKEFAKQLPVIGEPWVERVFDFSTQWEIQHDKTVKYIGATRILNTPEGEYLGNCAGSDEETMGDFYPYLKNHLQEGRKLLDLVAEKGYFGYAGLDAMIYRREGQFYMHPILELNARMTMGLAALFFQRRHFPNQTISLFYKHRQFLREEQKNCGLLPESVSINGRPYTFYKQLYYSFGKNLGFKIG